MLKLLKNADVYAPQHMGICDILIADEKIAAVRPNISGYDNLQDVEVFDLNAMPVSPGFIDLHVHVTGGGGEEGFASRVPEITLSQLTQNGVTTVVGLLGTDGITRSMENLLAKCRALQEEGITTFMLTGSYQYPSPTILSGIAQDIVVIDKAIGVKIAISDHRSSGITGQELIRLGTQARLGGLLSGKAGLVVLHVGTSDTMLEPLFYALEHSDIPPKNFLPTHVCRTPKLTAQAARFTQMGGNIDFTAGFDEAPGGTAAIVSRAIFSDHADPRHISISSDACGSQPVFDSAGACIGLTFTTAKILHDELVRFITVQHYTLEQALPFFTSNPARVLCQERVKGAICHGADADLIAYGNGFEIRHVFARGKCAIWNGEVTIKGRFE